MSSTVWQLNDVSTQLTEYLQNPMSTEGAVLYLILIVSSEPLSKSTGINAIRAPSRKSTLPISSMRRHWKQVTLKRNYLTIFRSHTRR